MDTLKTENKLLSPVLLWQELVLVETATIPIVCFASALYLNMVAQRMRSLGVLAAAFDFQEIAVSCSSGAAQFIPSSVMPVSQSWLVLSGALPPELWGPDNQRVRNSTCSSVAGVQNVGQHLPRIPGSLSSRGLDCHLGP